MADYAIRTEYVTREFGDVRAVDGISFEVPVGSVFGFLGANGAGKTTTIRLLLGLLEPSSGCATVLGYDTRDGASQIRAKTGALLEHDGLYERLSAADNLDYYARIWHMPREERRARIQELLTRVNLWDVRNEPVKEWSRGMRQKLSIARALLHRPRLIFLDEPTNGLDPMAAAALREELSKLAADEGCTVFITTHNLAEVERLCDRVAIMRRGRMLASGTLDELRALGGEHRVEISGRCIDKPTLERLGLRPDVHNLEYISLNGNGTGKVIVEMQPGAPASPLVTALVQSGAEIEEVQRHRPSLEEVFMNLMNAPEPEGVL